LTAETLLSGPLKWLLPSDLYRPGMGLIAGFLLLIVIGLLVNAYIVRRVFELGEALLLRVPVVKTVFARAARPHRPDAGGRGGR
jgi:uncharacterized membrane protein